MVKDSNDNFIDLNLSPALYLHREKVLKGFLSSIIKQKHPIS